MINLNSPYEHCKKCTGCINNKYLYVDTEVLERFNIPLQLNDPFVAELFFLHSLVAV